MSNKGKCTIAVTTIVLLLLIDQIIKVWVKLNMNIGEEIVVFNWFRISFIENRGMAFGMEIGSKLFLSLFRIVAVGALTWYIYKRIKEGARTGYIIVLSMIYAGAAGNILDSLFYGEIFTASHPYYTNLPPAHLVPWGEGYASVLMGNVVDMFSFPLFHGTFPEWLPVWRILLSFRQSSTLPMPASRWVWLCFSFSFGATSTTRKLCRRQRKRPTT